MPIPLPDSLALTPLQTHFQQCTFAAGACHRLCCSAEAIGAFLAPRFISMLTVMVALIGVVLSLQSRLA